MIRPPPRSPLFPSTTLSRSDHPPSSVTITFDQPLDQSSWMNVLDECGREIDAGPATVDLNELTRSEEHTSELQSRQYLVCRLPLEKKHLFNSSARPTWIRIT